MGLIYCAQQIHLSDAKSGHLRSLTAKFKFQPIAKQINNFERA